LASVSDDKSAGPDEAAFARLEEATSKLLERLAQESAQTDSERARGDAAEARVAELSQLLQRFTGDQAEADRLVSRLRRLEEENTDLRARIDRGRDGVERMIARIRFLENRG
jgi:predicted nuclease with TOPRIM domain